jgi:hypothetical protein
MGIELMTLTAKADPELAIWVEGMASNAFKPFRMTRSSFIAGVLTFVRNEYIAGRLDLASIALQGLNQNNQKSGLPGIPGAGPAWASRPARKKKEQVA